MKKFISLLFIFVLSSCELIVDVDVPFDRALLTINSFFNPDSIWSANLTLNRHILDDTSFPKIENGFIVINQNGVPVDTLIHQKNGLYKSDSRKPQAGLEYEIQASAQGYETVTGKVRIPMPAPIVNVKISKGPPLPEGGPNNQITITFQDNGAEANYYHIIVEQVYESYDFRTDTLVVTRQRLYMESDDPTISDENLNWVEGILLKDIFFNGKEIGFPFTINYNDFDYAAAVVVSLRTVSEDYYNYKTTFQLQENTSGDPFAQPVNVYTNIENGLGIFAGFSESRYIYESHPKPIITGITPVEGRAGDRIIVTGENFVETTENFYSVSFSGTQYPAYASAVRVSDNELEVIVPQQALTGKLVVYAGGRIAVSESEFQIVE